MLTVKATCTCGWEGNNFDLVEDPNGNKKNDYFCCPDCGKRATLHPVGTSEDF